MEYVYLDNAASSWPKPPGVAQAVAEQIERNGANPGRGSHRMAVEASRTIYRTRAKLAALFGVANPNDIAFAANTTAALNAAILGFVRPGDHVVCTAVEHNSVRRPLEWLRETKGVRVTHVATDPDGTLNAAEVERALASEKGTRLVVVNHSSNLLGSIAPLADISEAAKRHGAALLVDAAQTAGVLPIDVEALGIDMLAFPGHKALYGPQGTGGLYISPRVDLEPVIMGGTGSQSEAVLQPSVRPDRYESGTLNTPGIAGLGAGLDFVLKETPEAIHARERELVGRMMEGLLALEGVRVLGPVPGVERTGIVSFVVEGVDSAEISFVLDQHFRIAVRAGYHCTPLAHRTAGTFETGAVRASVGAFTTEDQIGYFLESVRTVVKALRGGGI